MEDKKEDQDTEDKKEDQDIEDQKKEQDTEDKKKTKTQKTKTKSKTRRQKRRGRNGRRKGRWWSTVTIVCGGKPGARLLNPYPMDSWESCQSGRGRKCLEKFSVENKNIFRKIFNCLKTTVV